MSVISSSFTGFSISPGEKAVTPTGCLRTLIEQGFVFDMEVYTLKNEEHPEYRKRRWRAEIWDSRDGKISGIGEGTRKALALNGAIFDLVENMRESKLTAYIPPCAIPTGVRISPSILIFLESLCKRENMKGPIFKETLTMRNGRESLQVQCIAGDISFKSHSFDQKYAKLQAARKVYNAISVVQFHLDEPFMGSECLLRGEYELVEADQNHIVNCSQGMRSTLPLKKRARIVSSTDPYEFPIFMKIRAAIEKRKKENGITNGNVSRLSPSSAAEPQFSRPASISSSTINNSRTSNHSATSGSVKNFQGIELPPKFMETKAQVEEPSVAKPEGQSYIDVIEESELGGFSFPPESTPVPKWPFGPDGLENPDTMPNGGELTPKIEPTTDWDYNMDHYVNQSSSMIPSTFTSTYQQAFPAQTRTTFVCSEPRPSTSKTAQEFVQFEQNPGGNGYGGSKFLNDVSNWNFFKKIVRGKLDQFSVLDEPSTENGGDEEVETKADGEAEVSLQVCGVGYGKTLRGAQRLGVQDLITATKLVRIMEEQLKNVGEKGQVEGQN